MTLDADANVVVVAVGVIVGVVVVVVVVASVCLELHKKLFFSYIYFAKKTWPVFFIPRMTHCLRSYDKSFANRLLRVFALSR